MVFTYFVSGVLIYDDVYTFFDQVVKSNILIKSIEDLNLLRGLLHDLFKDLPEDANVIINNYKLMDYKEEKPTTIEGAWGCG